MRSLVRALVVVVVLGATADAHATFPGRNGRIVFVRGVYEPNPQGPNEIARRIEIVNPDGSLRRAVTNSVYPVDDYDPAWQPLPRRNAGGASIR